MLRRRFLLICTASISGLWFAPSGLTKLSRNIVLVLSGSCSFCGKAMEEVRSMARAVGTSVRMCDECVGLCLDILQEDGLLESMPAAVKATRPSPLPASLEEETILRDLIKIRNASDEGGAYQRTVDEMIANMRARLDGVPPPFPPAAHSTTTARSAVVLACSFCSAHQSDVQKLIAGPSVYVCDACVGEAAMMTSKLTLPQA